MQAEIVSEEGEEGVVPRGIETTATGEQTSEGRAREDAPALSRLVRHTRKSPVDAELPIDGCKVKSLGSPWTAST